MSAIESMARQMRERLNTCQRGYIHQVLFGGLHLLLERRGDQWRLAIARIGATPSSTEAATVGRDFGLPAGIEWSYVTRPVKANAGRGKQPRLKYNVLECSWIEREPETERNHDL